MTSSGRLAPAPAMVSATAWGGWAWILCAGSGARGAGAEYLGRIVQNHEIRRTAYEVIKDDADVTLICEAEVSSVATDAGGAAVGLADGRRLHGKLLIAADSRFSGVRRKMGLAADWLDFGRVVIVCEMTQSANGIGRKAARSGESGSSVSMVVGSRCSKSS